MPEKLNAKMNRTSKNNVSFVQEISSVQEIETFLVNDGVEGNGSGEQANDDPAISEPDFAAQENEIARNDVYAVVTFHQIGAVVVSDLLPDFRNHLWPVNETGVLQILFQIHDVEENCSELESHLHL